MTAYDFELRKAAFRAAHELGFKQGTLVEGTYAWVRPHFSSPPLVLISPLFSLFSVLSSVLSLRSEGQENDC